MWHRGFRRAYAWRYGFAPFDFEFGPFGFHFHARRRYPRRQAYLRWLREYKEDLEEELKAVDEEIREVEGAEGAEAAPTE